MAAGWMLIVLIFALLLEGCGSGVITGLPSVAGSSTGPSNSAPAGNTSSITLSGPSSVYARLCSTAYTFTSLDANSQPVSAGTAATVTLSGASSGTFYSDSRCSNPVTAVTLGATESTATVYYKNSTAESVTLQASAASLVSSTATAAVTVQAALASPGAYDTTFGSSGVVATTLGGTGDAIYALKILSDGKIIAAGSTDSVGGNHFMVARYTATGTLDTTFGSSGKTITQTSTTNDFITALAIQSDGKIVGGGYAHNGSNYDFVIVRYTAAGALDTSFGTSSGYTRVAIGTGDDKAYSVVIQSDGKILLGGQAQEGANLSFVVVRFDSGGQLDTTWGTSGKTKTLVSAVGGNGRNLALQSDGKLIQVGHASSGGWKFTVIRYTTAGVVDTTFGTGGTGIVYTSLGATDGGYCVLMFPDDSFLVGGFSDNGFRRFAVVKYLATGDVDTTFGTSGSTITAFGNSDNYIFELRRQADGKIIGLGSAVNSSNQLVPLVVRYSSTGTLDNSFGSSGISANLYGSIQGYGYTGALQDDGMIVFGGTGGNKMLLGRYWP